MVCAEIKIENGPKDFLGQLGMRAESFLRRCRPGRFALGFCGIGLFFRAGEQVSHR